ncbi:hypothetical protein EJ110_NYTH05605 [Nymphaea thermarum]|nr:hypothetical protein EJ110_NYTH05605 [Nymphaea thermarum]
MLDNKNNLLDLHVKARNFKTVNNQLISPAGKFWNWASTDLTDNAVGRVHGYVRGSLPVAMLIGDDFDPAVPPPLQRRSKSSKESSREGLIINRLHLKLKRHHSSQHQALQLLLLVLQLFCLGEFRPLQPLHQLLDCLLDLLRFCSSELATDLAFPQRVSDCVGIMSQCVPRLCLFLVLVVLKLVPPGILNHPLDPLLRQSPRVATDGKMVHLIGGLVLRRDVQDTISIDLKAYVYSRNAARGRRDAGQPKFSQQGQRSDINNNQVRHHFHLLLVIIVFAQDGGLNCCTISDCLIWVDASAKLLTIAEILKQLLNLGDSSRSANHNDITDGVLGHSGVSQTILDGQ